MTATQLAPMEYSKLLGEIKERISSAQYEALKAVNKELISLYWDIGRMIVERQQGESWGKSVVEQLAGDLRKEFPGIQGFSAQNLWRMRQFYLTYQNDKKLSPMVREIGWTHNILIMMNCRDDLQKEFYIRMTKKFGWTKSVLINHIENQSYEKTLLGQTNFDKAVPAKIRAQAKLAIKDEYTFDFLELGEEHSERELERALIGKIEHFLREMGGMFAFLGSQYRLEVSDKEYFIDLLLFHRRLKCLVAIELKVTEFQPEYVGKMQFYLAALDDLIRLPDENPSIGIILCKTKNRIIVEYALKYADKPIGVSEYQMVKRLPKELKGQLPTPEQIERLLKDVE
jgi:predicted nuclease of restriction endonuclease-like (RecB) superfamily